MNPEPSRDNVLFALRALYHSPDAQEKERASAWLQEFQKSVYAWSIADQLLGEKNDLESCYFAAHTMRTKIQEYFYELPAESHWSLRDSLLNHISLCEANISAVVATQLCLALADFALLMAKWTTVIPDLLTRFAPKESSYPILLELLTVIPEEVTSRRLRLGTNRRGEICSLLSGSFDGVHQFLVACLSRYHTNPSLCSKIFKCLGSWFVVGAVPETAIMNSHLLPALFHFLADTSGDSSLHEEASDCLCNALYKCEDKEHYGQLSLTLYENVLKLHVAYQMCAAQSDTYRCLNLVRIFAEMAESFIGHILDTPNQGLGSLAQLDLLSSTLENENFEVAEISFRFWYLLSESLYNLDDPEKNKMFSSYIQKVIGSLCKQIELDPDLEGILESSDDFYDFRVRASDLIKDLVFVVSSSKLFQEMLYSIKDTDPWNVVEAHLFVMSSVAANIVPDENNLVPQVLNLILNKYCSPPCKFHVALALTAVCLVGELREWIQLHIDSLDSILHFLLLCLEDKRLANAAATSLDVICTQCASEHKMLTCFPTILMLVQEIDKFQINSESTVKILKVAATILSKFPNTELDAGIRQLCSYQVSPLKQLMAQQSGTSDGKKSSQADPGFWLDRLTSIIRYGVPTIRNGHHPCFQAIADIWCTLQDVCNKYQAEGKVIEKCCRCIRFVIRNLGQSFKPLLPQLVELMVPLYSAHSHSCYLYLGAILIDVFGDDPACIHGLLHMTEALAQPTFERLSKPNGLINHPDTVDDFFRLAIRFLQKNRLVLLSTPITQPLLHCAIASATLEHREANASVMRFFCELLTVPGDSRSEEAKTTVALLSKLLESHGQTLTDVLLQCCVAALPASMMVDVAEVILALLDFDRFSMGNWLQMSLQKLPRESAGGVVTATPQQLTDFHANIVKAKDARDIVPVLKEFLRLYR